MAKNKTSRRKRFLIIAVGGLLMIFVGLFLFRSDEAASEPLTDAPDTAVSRTTTANLKATGRVNSTQRATLSFNSPGRIASVSVKVGDFVAEGETLATLETTELEINLQMTEQNLAIQEARLMELEKGATVAEMVAAETAVTSAQAYLTQLQDGPRPVEINLQNAELGIATAHTWSAAAAVQQVNSSNTADLIAAAEAELALAQGELHQAQEINKDWKDEQTHRLLTQAEDRVAIAQARLDNLRDGPNVHDQGAAQAEVAAASAQEEAAKLQNEVFLRGGTPEQISVATSQLAQAEATLDSLRRGASDEQLLMAETAVTQAQLDVEAAQIALDNATLRAPFSGVIAVVHAAEGTMAVGPVIEMLNPDKLEVLLKVSEVDIGQFDIGQPVIIHTETWPTERLESRIRTISPSSILDDNRVNYEVRFALPQSEHPVRVGITVVAEIITEELVGETNAN